MSLFIFRIIPIAVGILLAGCSDDNNDSGPLNTGSIMPANYVTITTDNMLLVASVAYKTLTNYAQSAHLRYPTRPISENTNSKLTLCQSGSILATWQAENNDPDLVTNGDFLSEYYNNCIVTAFGVSVERIGERRYEAMSNFSLMLYQDQSTCITPCNIIFRIMSNKVSMIEQTGLPSTSQNSSINHTKFFQNGSQTYRVEADALNYSIRYIGINAVVHESWEKNADVTYTYDATTGTYAGTGALEMARSDLNGRIKVEANLTGNVNGWIYNRSYDYITTITATGSNNASVTVIATSSDVKVSIDANGDNQADDLPQTLNWIDFEKEGRFLVQQ